MEIFCEIIVKRMMFLSADCLINAAILFNLRSGNDPVAVCWI